VELQQRNLVAPGNDEPEEENDDDEANGETVYGGEYSDVNYQCESTEADQYKMNPEADQSDVPGEALVGHIAQSDSRRGSHENGDMNGENGDSPRYGEEEGARWDALNTSEEDEDEREGDGSRGLTEDDRQFYRQFENRQINNQQAVHCVPEAVRCGVPESVHYGPEAAQYGPPLANRNGEADGSNETINDPMRNIRIAPAVLGSAVERGLSPIWTNRNMEGDGSGHDQNTSSHGSTNRNNTADGSGSGPSSPSANRHAQFGATNHTSAFSGASRFSNLAQNASDIVPGCPGGPEPIGQRPATASGSDDEAFLSRQRRSPLTRHPRSAFTQPLSHRGGVESHRGGVGPMVSGGQGVGSDALSGHSGGVGQESDDGELYRYATAAARGSSSPPGVIRTVYDMAETLCRFKPIAVSAIDRVAGTTDKGGNERIRHASNGREELSNSPDGEGSDFAAGVVGGISSGGGAKVAHCATADSVAQVNNAKKLTSARVVSENGPDKLNGNVTRSKDLSSSRAVVNRSESANQAPGHAHHDANVTGQQASRSQTIASGNKSDLVRGGQKSSRGGMRPGTAKHVPPRGNSADRVRLTSGLSSRGDSTERVRAGPGDGGRVAGSKLPRALVQHGNQPGLVKPPQRHDEAEDEEQKERQSCDSSTLGSVESLLRGQTYPVPGHPGVGLVPLNTEVSSFGVSRGDLLDGSGSHSDESLVKLKSANSPKGLRIVPLNERFGVNDAGAYRFSISAENDHQECDRLNASFPRDEAQKGRGKEVPREGLIKPQMYGFEGNVYRSLDLVTSSLNLPPHDSDVFDRDQRIAADNQVVSICKIIQIH